MTSPERTSLKEYRFDDFIVDVENFRLSKDGREIALTPKAFDVLCLLLERHSKVIEKQTIFETIWKETFVSDHALTKIVKEIRHALDDPAREPKYVETVPKRGYRFIGTVIDDQVDENPESRLDDASEYVPGERRKVGRGVDRPLAIAIIITIGVIVTFAAWYISRESIQPKAQRKIPAIAVLPFKPIDTESRNESLEMGMAEALITRLNNVKELSVRPLTSVSASSTSANDPIAYGKQIGVDSLIDGSIQKAGDRVRVTVRLIDVASAKPLWSEQFDEAFTDIFKVQDSIAQRVADALRLRLTQTEQEQLAKHYTDNPEAYQLYLNAQLVWNGRRKNWIDQSLAFYKQAVEKDSKFALAYVGMADCYIMLNGHHRASAADTIESSKPLIEKALQLDDSLAQAHNALAELKYQYEFDWAGAESEFKKAIELNPNIAWTRQAYGWYLMSLARFDEANTQMETAHQLDPSSLTINSGRGRLLYYTRQFDKAIDHFKNIIAVEPADQSLYAALYESYRQAGRFDEAVEAYLTGLKLDGAPQTQINEVRKTYQTSGWAGFLNRRLAGLTQQATSGGDVSSVVIANVYIQLGNNDEALSWLTKAVDERETAVVQLKIEPAFDPLRSDPRFTQLLSRIGLGQ